MNGTSYICYQVKKNDGSLFPIQTGKILAAGKVGTDGVTMYKLWTTGGTKPTSSPALELPKSDLSENDSDYKHHVGMTFKQTNETQQETWLFVDKDGKVYKADFTIDPILVHESPDDTTTGGSTEG